MKFVFFLFSILSLSGSATADSAANSTVKIPVSSNLQHDGTLIHHPRRPLLLMFSVDNCIYCAIVREEFLEPMKISGDYEDKVLMRIVDMNRPNMVDFDGRPIRTGDLASRYKVKLTPTVVLVDASGAMLTDALVGITTRDYYGGYLDQAIETAQQKLHSH